MERAELVWKWTMELARRGPDPDVPDVALEVMRKADHDEATAAHALAIGRARLQEFPLDSQIERAHDLLERALNFLGLKREANEVGTQARPGG
jgi:hypothetical protein